MRIRIPFPAPRCKLLLRTVFLGFEPVFLLEFAVEIGLVRNPHAVHDLLNGEVGGRQQAGRILETVLLDEFARRASRNLLELPVEIAGRPVPRRSAISSMRRFSLSICSCMVSTTVSMKSLSV